MKILLCILLFPIFLLIKFFIKIRNLFMGPQAETFKHPKAYYSCLLPKNFVLFPAAEYTGLSSEKADFKTFIDAGTVSSISICVTLDEKIPLSDLDDAIKVLCHTVLNSYKEVELIYIKDIAVNRNPAKKIKARYIDDGEEYYLIGILIPTNNYPISIIIKCLAAMPAYIDMLTDTFAYNFKTSNSENEDWDD